MNGALYGTTYNGGSGSGTVFKMTKSGVETVLHCFSGGYSDGGDPAAPLVFVDGMLYGTTADYGGSACVDFGCATVFRLAP